MMGSYMSLQQKSDMFEMESEKSNGFMKNLNDKLADQQCASSELDRSEYEVEIDVQIPKISFGEEEKVNPKKDMK